MRTVLTVITSATPVLIAIIPHSDIRWCLALLAIAASIFGHIWWMNELRAEQRQVQLAARDETFTRILSLAATDERSGRQPHESQGQD